MRILYTPLHLLSSEKEKYLLPKRNLIPGGRTRPQRVKNFLLKLSKIFTNYITPAQVMQDYPILNNFNQFAKST